MKPVQTFRLLALAALFVLALPLPLRADPPGSLPIISFNFDWDDNVVHMPTKNLLFHKQTGKIVEISNSELAENRHEIGITGKYKDYEIRKVDPTHVTLLHKTTGAEKKVALEEWSHVRKNIGQAGTAWADYHVKPIPPDSSFHYVRSIHTENYFLRDLQLAVKSGNTNWQGPSWHTFIEAMQSEQTARSATIITARGQLPEDIYEGLLWLKERGIIEHAIPLENIYAVGRTENPSLAKVDAIRKTLNDLNKIPVSEYAPPMISRDGKSTERVHLWSFSDDDTGNYKKALEAVQADVKAGKYPNVKIAVFFTGKNTAHRPAPVIVMPDGRARPMLAAEFAEVPRMMPVRMSCSQMFEFFTRSRLP